MRQKLKDILNDFKTPLQSAGVILLSLMAFVMALWIVMIVVRLVMG